MRPALFTFTACLVTAATAVAQPTTTPTAMPAPATLPPVTQPFVYDTVPTPVAATQVLTDDPGRPSQTAWVTAEYLIWFTTPMNTPALVQTVPAGSAAPGQTLTGVGRLFPVNRQLDFNGQNGFRVSGGTYFGRNDDWGFDAGYYQLETKVKTVGAYTNGLPVAVGEQFFDASTGNPNTLFLSLLGQYVGGLTVAADTTTWGAEANVRYRWYALFADRTDFVTGFRFHELEESIGISANSIQANGTQLNVTDVVRTRNRFYGHQIGLASRFGACERGLGLDTAFKFGIGGVRQEAQIFGSNTITNPGLPPDRESLGLYARGTNNGNFARDEFAAMTDVMVNLTYNFTPRARVHFGYSLFWLSSVVRPGEMINPVINASQVRFINGTTPSTIPAPAFRWNTNDYWVQGMNFGANFAF